jgi:transcription initiation factor TFIIA small subunit
MSKRTKKTTTPKAGRKPKDSENGAATTSESSAPHKINQYALYRKTTLGNCLTDALDELTQRNAISPELATKVLEQFDKSMCEALATKVRTKVTFKGGCEIYRNVDDVWTFLLKDTTFTIEAGSDTIHVDRVKIVACDGKSEKG